MTDKCPISRNPEEVTKRILNAAQSEFMDNGFGAASTNRIATIFGGSKATLYRHYPTKEALLRAVVERITQDWPLAVRTEQISSDDAREWLFEFGVIALKWILGDGALFVGRIGVSEGAKLPALEHLFHELAGVTLRAAVANRLKEWTAQGKLNCWSFEADAQAFLDLTVAGPVSRALYGIERLAGEDLERHTRRSVDLFLNGRLKADPV